ncbi:MAG TPA: biotin/lipoyl-binding protein [Chloroflexi bacterium]|nr:biotin/lipoyl-binding protein [Chloroflexota bacterium]
MKYTITVDEDTFEIEVGHEGRVWVNQDPYDVDFRGLDGLPEYSLLLNNRSYEALVEQLEARECCMMVAGRSYRARLQQDEGCDDQAQSGEVGEVRAPLPGLLIDVAVREGQSVSHGDVVAILESMKMNLELRAPRDGVVQSVHAAPGAEIGQGDLLVGLG